MLSLKEYFFSSYNEQVLLDGSGRLCHTIGSSKQMRQTTKGLMG